MLPSPAVPRRIRKALPALIAALALGTGLAACGDGGADLPQGVVAQIGDASIAPPSSSARWISARRSPSSRAPPCPSPAARATPSSAKALDALVQQRIVEFEARKCGEPCKVTKDDVDDELERVKEARGETDEEFATFLRKSAITPADARSLLRAGMQQDLLYDHVTRGVRFTAEDAKKYYDDHPAEFRQAAGRTVSHILLKTKAEADGCGRRRRPRTSRSRPESTRPIRPPPRTGATSAS